MKDIEELTKIMELLDDFIEEHGINSNLDMAADAIQTEIADRDLIFTKVKVVKTYYVDVLHKADVRQNCVFEEATKFTEDSCACCDTYSDITFSARRGEKGYREERVDVEIDL
jgi:hypothetical protein